MPAREFQFGSGFCAVLQWAFSETFRYLLLLLGLSMILHVHGSASVLKILGDPTLMYVFPDEPIELFLTQE